jgi:hypothetical protein
MGERRPDQPAIASTSRRTFVTAVCAAPIARPARAGVVDEIAAATSRRWLAMNAEAERLQLRWAKREAALMRLQRRSSLGDGVSGEPFADEELVEIEATLEKLNQQCAALLQSLIACSVRDLRGVLAKVTVALAIVPQDENENAHALLASVLRDVALV